MACKECYFFVLFLFRFCFTGGTVSFLFIRWGGGKYQGNVMIGGGWGRMGQYWRFFFFPYSLV